MGVKWREKFSVYVCQVYLIWVQNFSEANLVGIDKKKMMKNTGIRSQLAVQ